MEVRVLAEQDHEVLGAEYCSGYTDIFGKWNTGFDCPSMGNGEPVYCCGMPTYKYCCTKRDEEHTSGLDQMVLLGMALGVLLFVVIVTLVSCLVCRRCMAYRRRHPSLNGGPLYTMHCSSTASGVANMYSFSGQNSAATTPIDTAEPHVLMDLDRLHPTSNSVGIPNHQVPVYTPATSDDTLAHIRGNHHHHHIGRHLSCHGHLPNEPPPPYQPDSPASSLIFNEQEPLHSVISSPSTTSFTQSHRVHLIPNSPDVNSSERSSHTSVTSQITSVPTREDTLYWSTKF